MFLSYLDPNCWVKTFCKRGSQLTSRWRITRDQGMGFSFDSAISFFCYYLPCAHSTSPGQSYIIHVKHVMCRNIIYRRSPFNQTFRNLLNDGNFIGKDSKSVKFPKCEPFYRKFPKFRLNFKWNKLPGKKCSYIWL